MSFETTRAARSATRSGVIEPQIVVQIEGYSKTLTSATIVEAVRFDDGLLFDDGWLFDDLKAVDEQEDLISLDGTTNNITQQLMPTEGGTSSTTNVTIAIVNKDNRFKDMLRPQGSNDIISKKASVYLGVSGTAFPEDFIRIFVGNVTQVSTPQGMIRLTVSHPEHLKRAELFQKISTELTDELSDTATTIPLLSTEGMLLPQDLLTTYVRINDEIIRYTGISGNSLTGCTRARLNTFAAEHELEDTVETFYVLGDATQDSNAITLALKVLISGSEQPWISDKPVSSIGVSPDINTINSIVIPGEKLRAVNNLTAGDFCTITDAGIAGNNVINAVVSQVIDEDIGTRVVLSGVALAPELDSSGAMVSFTSRFATLPDGVGMTPDQVDIDEFENVLGLFGSSIPNYSIYLKDTINGKDLVNKEILFPAACYSLPRKGRVSVGKARPPVAEARTVTIDESTVLNASELSIERSMLDNFYNAVVYKFEQDSIEDKFLQGRVTVSASSINRIKTGNNPFVIESRGLRKTNDNEPIIANNARNLLERYQFGAEVISNVRVPFGVGWNMEVGDTVIVEGLGIYDTKTGEMGLSPRIFEVQNRGFNFRQGMITLSLIDTAFSSSARYGVITPSSLVESASEETRLIIKRSFGTPALEPEQEKWRQFIGLKICVHDESWTEIGHATLLGFDPANQSAMLLSEGLGFVPGPDYIIEAPHYQQADALWKAVGVYMAPHVLVTSGESEFSFRVDKPEVFFEGAIVIVHSQDYSVKSDETSVVVIDDDLIVVATSLSFEPQEDYQVSLIGFVSDQGLPYRYF
jgi:hypothetical protein